MTSAQKMLRLLTVISDKNHLPVHTERIELKADKSGFWRVYFATPGGASKDELAAVQLLAEEHSAYANGFSDGRAVTAVTIVDYDAASSK